MNWTNPTIPGFHPDPSVCRVGNDFYLVTSSFEYFPGVPLFHSTDLVSWTQIGHCLTRTSQLDLAGCGASGGIYAPTIRHHKGRLYLITTNVSGIGNFMVWTDDIRGAWSDPIPVESPGIDPSLLFDDDGTVYYTGNNGPDEPQGIYGFAINLENGRMAGPRTRLWGGTGGAYPEGPHLYHIGAWYYLLISEGGTEHGHMITVARSTKPLGPFEGCPHNPVLSNRSILTKVKATGHADIVQGADGRWWAVCLAIRPQGYPEVHWLGRETFLVPVAWDAEGWPLMGRNGQVDLTMEAEGPRPGPPAPPQPATERPVGQEGRFGRTTFDVPALGPEWNFLRTPCTTLNLGTRQGWLSLTGNAHTLDDQASPAFVGRRIQDLELRVATHLAFDPQRDGEEAGLCILMNNRHHYEIALTMVGTQRVLVFRRRIGSLQTVEAELPWNGTEAELGICTRGDTWDFTAAHPGHGPTVLGSGECRYLSTEVGGAFTGAFVGLYTTGNGHPAHSPAAFKWFDYLRP